MSQILVTTSGAPPSRIPSAELLLPLYGRGGNERLDDQHAASHVACHPPRAPYSPSQSESAEECLICLGIVTADSAPTPHSPPLDVRATTDRTTDRTHPLHPLNCACQFHAHHACLEAWWRCNPICPLCREPIDAERAPQALRAAVAALADPETLSSSADARVWCRNILCFVIGVWIVDGVYASIMEHV
jgi:hypothetical protein